jgi:type IV fimbrial biogenesis protein FimT
MNGSIHRSPDDRKGFTPAGGYRGMGSPVGRSVAEAPGFTLVEVMIAIALASLLLVVAIPSFRTMLLNNRMLSHANSLVGALNLARSEAVKRSGDVSVCRRDGSDWQQGWRVLTGGDCAIDTGEIELSVEYEFEGLQQVSGTANSLTFSGNGIPSTTLLFTLCDERGAANARAVYVNAVGQVKSMTTKDDGAALTCS